MCFILFSGIAFPAGNKYGTSVALEKLAFRNLSGRSLLFTVINELSIGPNNLYDLRSDFELHRSVAVDYIIGVINDCRCNITGVDILLSAAYRYIAGISYKDSFNRSLGSLFFAVIGKNKSVHNPAKGNGFSRCNNRNSNLCCFVFVSLSNRNGNGRLAYANNRKRIIGINFYNISIIARDNRRIRGTRSENRNNVAIGGFDGLVGDGDNTAESVNRYGIIEGIRIVFFIRVFNHNRLIARR